MPGIPTQQRFSDGNHRPRYVLSLDLRLPMQTASPLIARRHTVAFLQQHALDACTDDAALIVTELVTNAVLHGDEPIRLGLEVGDVLRIEVFDGDHRTRRVVTAASPGVTGGRGLQIVGTLADRWGVTTAPVGKLVWAEISLHSQ